MAGLDTSHFLGKSWSSGKQLAKKILCSEILVNPSRFGRKEHCRLLRRAMLEVGIPYVCGVCGLVPRWNEIDLILEIHHKDGDNMNNIRENVQFICPNCHSQTSNYGSKNLRR